MLEEDINDKLSTFMIKWNLDSGSEALLLDLSEDILQEVLDTFNPPEDTRNKDAKLKMFVRSLEKNTTQGWSRQHQSDQWSEGRYDRPMERRSSQDNEDDIVQFALKWELDDSAVQMLENLSYDRRAEVIADFNPPEDTQNVSAKLQSFVRGRPPGKGSGRERFRDEITEFVESWGVDAESEALLRSLAVHHLDAVLAEFNPKSGTRNVSGKLTSYVRSVIDRDSAGKGQGRMSEPSWREPPVPRQHNMPDRRPHRDDIAEFVVRWGLDTESEVMLRDLAPHHLDIVLAEFQPQSGTRNVNAKLTSFVRAVSNSDGSSKGRGRPGHDNVPVPAPRRRRLDPIAEFVQQWDLDREAEDLLLEQPRSVQDRILADFNPPPDTRNVSGKLTAFIRHMGQDGARGGRGSGMKRPRADPVEEFASRWQIDEDAQRLLHSLPRDVQESVMRDFQPPSGTLNYSGKLCSFIRTRLNPSSSMKGQADPRGGFAGGGYSRDSRHKRSSDPIADFVQQWDLDSGSEKLVRSLPDDLQREVFENFQPEPGTRNPNAKLATWIKTIRGDEGPPAKRARR